MTGQISYLTSLLQRLPPAPSPQEVADVLIPEVADFVLLFVVDHEQRLELVASRHLDPNQRPLLEELARIHRPRLDDPLDPVAQAVRTDTGRLITWIQRDDVVGLSPDGTLDALFDALLPRNVVIAPFRDARGNLGALVVAVSASGRRFIPRDLDFLEAFACRIGPSISPSTGS